MSAKVESLYVSENGDVRLRLAGGGDIDMRQVLGIAEAGQAAPAAPTTPAAAS